MNRKSLQFRAIACCLSIGLVIAESANAGVVVSVEGNIARADIALGGTPENPQYTANVSFTFDSAIGLSAENLNITAQIIDPSDPALQARLPDGNLVSVPSNFPVLISVNPLLAGGFEFLGAAYVDIYTTNLSYTGNSPYRLYKASTGAMFTDLTEDVIPGSIRCRSRTGGFSDFLIVVDLRSPREAAEDKFAFLNARLLDAAIEPAARGAMQRDLEESYVEFLEGDYEDAREELDDLELRVTAVAGTALPNRWRAGGDLDNIAGSLESSAASLDFNLRQLEDEDEDEDEEG